MASIHDKSDVLDENGNLLYRVHSRALSIHDKTYIEDTSGNEVAYIHAKAVSIHHVYYVELASGASFELHEELNHVKDVIDVEPIGWQLRGDSIIEFDFHVYDDQQRTVATAHRNVVSLHDIYDMDVLDESKADIVVAIFVIMRHIVEQRNQAAGMAASSSSAGN